MYRSSEYFDSREKLDTHAQIGANSLVKVLVIAVLILSLLLVVVMIRSDISSSQTKFDEHVSNLSNHVYSTLLTNQTILESFAALLSVVGYQDKNVMVQYVHNLVKSYSKIYIIETVHRIRSSQVDEIAQQQMEVGNHQYKLKAYVYNSRYHFVDVEEKAFYYPIVFMEPATEEQKGRVLGLDIESIPFLRRAMVESVRDGTTVMSRPFELLEGDFGYVMLHPSRGKAVEGKESDQLLALLVIRAKEMLPDNLTIFPGARTRLRHPAFLPGEEEGSLLDITGVQRSEWEKLLFPKLTYSNSVGQGQQQFKLDMEWQLGWSNVNWGLVLVVIMLAMVLISGVLIYGRYYRRNEESLERARYGLFIMTYYDSLTQLPNRAHLLSHLHNILTVQHSPEFLLTLLSVEINDFEDVVSRHGEVVGDMLMVTLTGQMRDVLTSVDFLARSDRSKYVIVSDNIVDRDHAAILADKIKAVLEDTFTIAGNKISVSISIGVAVYPDDGKEVKDLIKIATDASKAS